MLASAGAVLGFLSAPLLLRLASQATRPGLLAALLLAATYELGLWGAGLLSALAALRLRWAQSWVAAVGLTASPAIAETVLLRLVGGGAGSLLTLGTRLVVGGAALLLARWLARRPKP